MNEPEGSWLSNSKVSRLFFLDCTHRILTPKGLTIIVNKLDFIYFDLGNVLLHFSRERQFRQMAQVLGITAKEVAKLVALLLDHYHHSPLILMNQLEDCS